MAKYRKRPVIVEATQWFPGKQVPGVFDRRDSPYVITIHGQKTIVMPGDWIITEPDGIHHYPCKPDIFAATYGPVD
jgi:hypothetical protein